MNRDIHEDNSIVLKEDDYHKDNKLEIKLK